jgi:hypothetical protein
MKKRRRVRRLRKADIVTKIAIGTGLAAAFGLKGYQTYKYKKTHGGPKGPKIVTGSLRYL